MAQIEYQYPFLTIYDQEISFYKCHQGSMNNSQWYEGFNTKVDVYKSIGVNLQHKSLLEYVAQESYSLKFDSFMEEQLEAMHIDSEEIYLYYVLLIKSGNQHIKLNLNLHQDSCKKNAFI